jgi:hypothetical protein
VLVPLIPRELDAAVANLKIWNHQDTAPSRRVDALKPVFIFCMNCGYDAAIEKMLTTAYEACPNVVASFSSMIVHFCDLPPEKDLYIRDGQGPAPEFGYKSGPNWMFYEAMRFAKRYGGYCLQIETDCRPIAAGWLDTLTDVARRSADKLIVGSPYRGQGQLWRAYARHINGNALYNVGDAAFWEWLDGLLWPWLCEVTGSTQPSLAYDCAWEAYIHREELDASDHLDWLKIRKYVDKFVASTQLVNIAGGVELRKEYIWTLRRIKEDFPEAVMIHGPFTTDSEQETSPVNIGALAAHAGCKRLSPDTAEIAGLTANNDFLFILFGRFRIDFQADYPHNNSTPFQCVPAYCAPLVSARIPGPDGFSDWSTQADAFGGTSGGIHSGWGGHRAAYRSSNSQGRSWRSKFQNVRRLRPLSFCKHNRVQNMAHEVSLWRERKAA